MTVHGIGHHGARDLYSQGFRSAEDMRKSGRWEKEFRYHDDIQHPIPRAEVESIARFVQIQVERIEYRRGKTMSNDVDLLITFPHQDGRERGLLRRLCHRLEVKGFIPPDGILSFSEPATLRSTRENKKAGSFDALDKALIVFKHVANSTTRKRDHYRRVDLIIARWPSFGAAIVGWSGSTQFERDLRRHAEKLGFKFDSGGLRVRGTNEVVPTAHERDVFRALSLKWIHAQRRPGERALDRPGAFEIHTWGRVGNC
ncbi:DNA polymerase mu [Rhodotorula diobovata]|uniref:DNA polymerase mu n=1 Tax=Rhodotorula diobovata TaxID=5288 RepID=A0A5C5FQW8_9BASI|nr:DNA polymerase mu [Rhodotorula diobovata]